MRKVNLLLLLVMLVVVWIWSFLSLLGKSSLVKSILGEMPKRDPETNLDNLIHIRGTIGYVPQTPFIMNATLRDNILFGSPFNQELYDVFLISFHSFNRKSLKLVVWNLILLFYLLEIWQKLVRKVLIWVVVRKHVFH